MSSCLIFTFLFTFVLVVTLLPLNASSLGDSHESDGHSQHHNAFGNTDGGHESGYELAKQGGHHDDHAIHEAAATHQATGDGEKSRGASAHHTTMEADGSAAKFHEADSQHGKDLKAKTFGFFDYRFIQPQYHVEQFYEDEKQGKQYGADKHKAGEVDHHHDEHETDGKDRFEESHNLGAHGAADYSKGVDGHKGSGNGWSNGYGNKAESDHNYGRGEHGRQYGHEDESAPPIEHHHDHYYPSNQHQGHLQAYGPRYEGRNAGPEHYFGPPHGSYQE